MAPTESLGVPTATKTWVEVSLDQPYAPEIGAKVGNVTLEATTSRLLGTSNAKEIVRRPLC